MNLRRGIKSAAKAIGLEIHRYDPRLDPAFQLVRSFERFGIDLVFDVGANIGQFATEIRAQGYRGELVSFEPLSAAHAALVAEARGDARWRVHQRVAIGDRDGQIEINIASNSVSSSVLPMLESHASAERTSAYVGVERVPICRLDAIVAPYWGTSRSAILKIDTQGFESQVLDGARETLPRVRGILCELSLVPLYDGQVLWRDMIRRLEGEGLSLWSMTTGFTDSRDGRTLQLDATFFRL